MKTRQAFTMRFYSKNKLQNYFYKGKMKYFIEFRKQLERFCRTLENRPTQQDIDCVLAENVITKAKVYLFSDN